MQLASRRIMQNRYHFNFDIVVSTILSNSIFQNLLKLSLFNRIGALTSKPFAYKSRSWELNTSYIIDPTTYHADKIWLDLKALEIMRILPWINILTEEYEFWISDKSWFFYDGLNLNWITKYFFWWKLILISVLLLIGHLCDRLFLKYFRKSQLSVELKQLASLKNSPGMLIFFYFSFFKSFNIFRMKAEKFWLASSTKKIPQKVCLTITTKWNSFSRFGYSWWFINFKIFWKLLNKKPLIKKLWSFIYMFFWNRMYAYKRRLPYFWTKLTGFSYLTPLTFFPFFFATFVYPQWQSNIILFTDLMQDSLTVSLSKQLVLLKSKKHLKLRKCKNLETYNFSFSSALDNWQTGQSYFDILTRLHLSTVKWQIIFLLNVNIWYISPKIHLFLWWLNLLNNSLVISFGSTDQWLFKSLDFGFKKKLIVGLFTFWTWLINFFVTRPLPAFFSNSESAVFKQSISVTFWNLACSQLNNKYFTNWQLATLANPYYYSVGTNLSTNIFSSYKLRPLNKINLWRYTTLQHRTFRSLGAPGLFVFFGKEAKKTTKLIRYFEINQQRPKWKVFILFESNIHQNRLEKQWDAVLPQVTLTETFLLYKNSKNFTAKSLFIKFGPWYARTNFNFLWFLTLMSSIPFLWLNYCWVSNSLFIHFLFYNFWLQANFFPNWKIIKFSKSFLSNLNICHNIIQNYLNNIPLYNYRDNILHLPFVIRNFWFSELSIITNSQYVTFGYNLVNYEWQTISIF
jgi:hypothetical protein